MAAPLAPVRSWWLLAAVHLAVVVAAAAAAGRQPGDEPAEPPAPEVEKFIEQYGWATPYAGAFRHDESGQEPAALVVTKAPHDYGHDRTTISAGGLSEWEYADSRRRTAHQSGDRLTPAALGRLRALMDRLPAGVSELPPAERRLLIQSAEGRSFRSIVLDRAALPTEALLLLEAAKVRRAALFRSVPPTRSWPLGQREDFSDATWLPFSGGAAAWWIQRDGTARLCGPDGVRRTAEATGPGLRYFWGLSAEGATLSPDGTVVAKPDGQGGPERIRTADWTRLPELVDSREEWERGRRSSTFWTRFTPDGGTLLAYRREGPRDGRTSSQLVAYSTKTWEQVDASRYGPPGTTKSFVSPDGRLAVVEQVDPPTEEDLAADERERAEKVFNPDARGRRLAARMRVLLWDLRERRVLWALTAAGRCGSPRSLPTGPGWRWRSTPGRRRRRSRRSSSRRTAC